MPRIAKSVITNVPYHVTQRGNRQQDVFFNADDRKRFLNWLSMYAARFRFDIQAYCLMSNHIHLVGFPRKPDSMARTMKIVQVRHAKAINRDKGWQGHLWQRRYFAAAMDESHMWLAIRYVEQNPVRAGIVAKAEDYIWSSAGYHCGLRDDDPVVKHDKRILTMFDNWSKILRDIPSKENVELLQRRTRTGIPCGDDKFLRRMSKRTGHQYTEREQGRPRKAGV